MTRKELSQLNALKSEIKMLEKEKREVREALRKMENWQHGAVTGSNSQFPYNPRTFSVGGLQIRCTDKADYVRKRFMLRELQTEINNKQDECLAERARLTRFINSIPDSFTRQVFMLRYTQGLTWAQVADRIGGKNTEDSVRKICERHTNK